MPVIKCASSNDNYFEEINNSLYGKMALNKMQKIKLQHCTLCLLVESLILHVNSELQNIYEHFLPYIDSSDYKFNTD